MIRQQKRNALEVRVKHVEILDRHTNIYMVCGELAEFILVVVVVFFCIFPLMNDLFVDNNTWKRRKREIQH